MFGFVDEFWGLNSSSLGLEQICYPLRHLLSQKTVPTSHSIPFLSCQWGWQCLIPDVVWESDEEGHELTVVSSIRDVATDTLKVNRLVFEMCGVCMKAHLLWHLLVTRIQSLESMWIERKDWLPEVVFWPPHSCCVISIVIKTGQEWHFTYNPRTWHVDMGHSGKLASFNPWAADSAERPCFNV